MTVYGRGESDIQTCAGYPLDADWWLSEDKKGEAGCHGNTLSR